MEASKLEVLKDETKYRTANDKRRRGYEFEQYLYDTFEQHKFKIKRPFKKAGEQIDGGVYFDGTWYLVEAKWHADPLPVSEVYSFRGKVDGKFAGTRGIFISWSGYSKECADALSLGKELNVILFDASDVKKAESVGWQEIFLEKLMYASLYGLIYVPDTTRRSVEQQEAQDHRLEVFVEGDFDARIVSSFLNHLGVTASHVIIPSGSKPNAIRLASSLPKSKGTRRILILDADGNLDQDDELRNLPLVDVTISIEPEIESLFFPASDDPKREFYRLGPRARFSGDVIDGLTLDALRTNPQGFVDRLKDAVGQLKSKDGTDILLPTTGSRTPAARGKKVARAG